MKDACPTHNMEEPKCLSVWTVLWIVLWIAAFLILLAALGRA
jgi:hypothetical protein